MTRGLYWKFGTNDPARAPRPGDLVPGHLRRPARPTRVITTCSPRRRIHTDHPGGARHGRSRWRPGPPPLADAQPFVSRRGPTLPAPPSPSHRHRLKGWQQRGPVGHRVLSGWMLRGSEDRPASRPPASGPGATGRGAFGVRDPRPVTGRSVRAGPRRSRNWPAVQLWPCVPHGVASFRVQTHRADRRRIAVRQTTKAVLTLAAAVSMAALAGGGRTRCECRVTAPVRWGGSASR